MGLIELFLIAVGLSMDAFAVSICTGLSIPKTNYKNAIIVGLYFGIFQAFMPLTGYMIGSQFADHISSFDHWISFILLFFIGGKMVKDSFSPDEEPFEESSLSPKKMIPLAVATSIDALAAGVSFAFLKVHIIPAILFIGIVTLIFSMAGVKIGNLFGTKYKSKAEFIGGLILILMGFKILFEHLGFINF